MPASERDHYESKIAVFIVYWREKKGVGIVDEGPRDLEARRQIPSWRRIAKVILKNDRICKGLSFSQQQSNPATAERYKLMMRRKRAAWGMT